MKLYLLFVFFFFQVITAKSQENKQVCVAFYNVENLFDTIDAAYKQDYEHLPDAQKKWNTAKYEKKLHNIARVIAALNAWKAPDLIGLGEVENRQVLEDLVSKTLGPISKPEKIQITSGLPKTRSGKIMRRILRKVAAGEFENLGDISTLLNPECVEEVIKGRV